MRVARSERWTAAAAAAAAVGIAAGLVWNPDRTWAAILMASFGLLGLGLGGLFFVALNDTCGASWAVALRRVPEAMVFVLPFGAAGLAVVFAVKPSIYPWIAHAEHFEGFKGLWLSPGFFLGRAVTYVSLWLLFAIGILRASRALDRGAGPALTTRTIALSVSFVVVFAFTFWLASFDWIMSLEPHWYSTIFGVYNFAGLFTSTLAAVILLVLRLRASGVLRSVVRDEHLHDLGKLLFAFCVFWMYIWFSQYMLIWYSNLPEEAVYFVRRQTGTWRSLFYLNVLLNWAVPFALLLPKKAKLGQRLAWAAVTVLAGRILDLYLMVRPAVVSGGPSFGVWEAAPLVLAGTVFVAVFARAFRSAAPVPAGDPRLAESRSYHSS